MKINSSLTRLATLVVTATTLGVCSPLSTAAGYQVLSDTTLPTSAPAPSIQSIKVTNDGEFLVLGHAVSNQIWIVKVDRNGQKAWDRVVQGRRGSSQRALFALEATGGGYWIVGLAKELEFIPEADAEAMQTRKRPYEIDDIAFVLKTNATGNIEKIVPLGLLKDYRRGRLVCGIRTGDGMVLVGTKLTYYPNQPPTGGRQGLQHPWIVKLDTEGKVVWEATIAGDEEGLFVGTQVFRPKACSGPFVDGTGRITFGLELAWRPTYRKDGNRVVIGPGTEDKSKRSYLVVRVGADGNGEQIRRLDDELLGHLLPDANGYVLVSNTVPAFRGAIRRTWLDQDLNVIRKTESKSDGFSLVLDGVAKRKNGGYHVAGYRVVPPDERGQTAIGYLTAEDRLIDVRRFGYGLPSWNVEAFAGGANEDEAAMVLVRDAEVRLLRLRYQD